MLENDRHFSLDIRHYISHQYKWDEEILWRKRKMPRGTCPECDADVQVDEDTDKGDVVDCDDCGTQLEVVGLDPIELDIAVEEEEDDWEDES
jgi:alpha-aminoadipate/glutamate carrier protein LysW